MAAQHIEPHLVMADERGNIYDDPDLLMVCRRGAQWGLPRPDELIPLPDESEFFLLPGRNAVGLDPETGLITPPEGEAPLAVAASRAMSMPSWSAIAATSCSAGGLMPPIA